MGISIVKPAKAGTLRVELSVTHGQLATARGFDPTALNVMSDDKKEIVFSVVEGAPQLGRKGLAYPKGEAKEKVEFLISGVATDSPEFVALATRANGYLAIVEKQVAEANAKFAEAKKGLKEV